MTAQIEHLVIRSVHLLDKCDKVRLEVENLLERKRKGRVLTDLKIAREYDVFIGSAEFDIAKTRKMQDLAMDGIETSHASLDLLNEVVDFIRDVDTVLKHKEDLTHVQ